MIENDYADFLNDYTDTDNYRFLICVICNL